ncbi:uncharacterized protein LOC114957507 [Acropora millepora]|uniref:uncharacterized protein LOC114957507 n=1 Tax=Acropora millepora TaxID=45264 RepID=UPI001CF37182|nr:uncharacterized protein LOC114957507 [Acropora millepora]
MLTNLEAITVSSSRSVVTLVLLSLPWQEAWVICSVFPGELVYKVECNQHLNRHVFSPSIFISLLTAKSPMQPGCNPAAQLSLKTRAMDVVMGVQAMYETILHKRGLQNHFNSEHSRRKS